LTRDRTNCVFLLERVARRKGRQPSACTGKRRTPHAPVIAGHYVSDEFAGTPLDRAVSFPEQGAELRNAVRVDKGVGILLLCKKPRLENAQRRRDVCLGASVDRARKTLSTWTVVVESQNDRLDAEAPEVLDGLRRNARSTNGSDVQESIGSKPVYVNQPLHEKKLTTFSRGQPDHLRHAVRRKV
jgi:hypothetical protein